MKFKILAYIGLSLGLFLIISYQSTLFAQRAETSSIPGVPDLTGPQKRVLLLIAKEALNATLESRPSREATVEPRLTLPQPVVVSIYVDNRLRARAWRLRGLQSLYIDVQDLTHEAINVPKITSEPLTIDDLSRAEVGVAVLSQYLSAKDDRDVPPGEAVIIYNGFIEWLAIPGDIKSKKPADLLSYACEQAGLRPNAWLMAHKTTIYAARVEELRERKASILQ